MPTGNACQDVERLFDLGVRTNPLPAASDEDSFRFMNRVDQPFWERIRDELEGWFAGYPREHAPDLRARFRNAAPAQHFAAWWELYVHRAFTQLGFGVEVHPALPETSRRPDFRVTGEGDSFLVEAATTFSGIVDDERHAERDGWIIAAIEKASSPNFDIQLEVERSGLQRPAVREIVEPVERWLAALDPDDAIAAGYDARPTLPLSVRDWELTLAALPRKRDARGRRDRPGVLPPMSTGYVDTVAKLRGTLTRKRRQHGVQEEPVIVAVLLVSGFVDDEDIARALLGDIGWQFDRKNPSDGRWVRERNGFWMQGSRARGTRISAVLTANGLTPQNAAKAWPRLWSNPWARRPLSAELPFPTASADRNGGVTYQDVEVSPAALLGIPEDWPGPEGPFSKGSEETPDDAWQAPNRGV